MLDLLAMDGWLYSLTDLSPLLRHAGSMILLTLLCVHGQLVMARFDLKWMASRIKADFTFMHYAVLSCHQLSL